MFSVSEAKKRELSERLKQKIGDVALDEFVARELITVLTALKCSLSVKYKLLTGFSQYRDKNPAHRIRNIGGLIMCQFKYHLTEIGDPLNERFVDIPEEDLPAPTASKETSVFVSPEIDKLSVEVTMEHVRRDIIPLSIMDREFADTSIFCVLSDYIRDWILKNPDYLHNPDRFKKMLLQ